YIEIRRGADSTFDEQFRDCDRLQPIVRRLRPECPSDFRCSTGTQRCRVRSTELRPVRQAFFPTTRRFGFRWHPADSTRRPGYRLRAARRYVGVRDWLDYFEISSLMTLILTI